EVLPKPPRDTDFSREQRIPVCPPEVRCGSALDRPASRTDEAAPAFPRSKSYEERRSPLPALRRRARRFRPANGCPEFAGCPACDPGPRAGTDNKERAAGLRVDCGLASDARCGKPAKIPRI